MDAPAPTADCGRWVTADGTTWTCDPAAFHPVQPGPNWGRVGSVGLMLGGLVGGFLAYRNKSVAGYLAANAAALGGMWWLNSTLPSPSAALPGIVTTAAAAGLAIDYVRPGGINTWGKR